MSAESPVLLESFPVSAFIYIAEEDEESDTADASSCTFTPDVEPFTYILPLQSIAKALCLPLPGLSPLPAIKTYLLLLSSTLFLPTTI